MKHYRQQHPRPVLIEPDSDDDEPPMKRLKHAPLSPPLGALLAAAALEIQQKRQMLGAAERNQLDRNRITRMDFVTKIVNPWFPLLGERNAVEKDVLIAISPPPKIPKLLLPPGRPLGAPPRLPRVAPGTTLMKKSVSQR